MPREGRVGSETPGELVHNEYGETGDDCKDDMETREIIVDDVESVLTDSCWERAEDNGSVGMWQDGAGNNDQCLQGQGLSAGDQTRPCHYREDKEYCQKVWNYQRGTRSIPTWVIPAIFIESKRFIWTGCISAEQNDWHRSINKRLMNHCFLSTSFDEVVEIEEVNNPNASLRKLRWKFTFAKKFQLDQKFFGCSIN